MSDDAAREAIVGTWRLRSYEDRDTASQPWFHPYGEHPIGILVYHRSGTLSIQVFPDPAADTPARAIGYVGTFAIREATTEGAVTSGVLGHHMDAASEPSLLTEDTARPFTVSGDELTLGDGVTWRRVFTRVV